MKHEGLSTIKDPTLDLVEIVQIYPIEVVVGVVLLIYAAAAEVLAMLIHGLKDSTSPISRFAFFGNDNSQKNNVQYENNTIGKEGYA